MTAASKKPLDRRQRKTRDAIHTALMSLMSEKPIDRITVSELALRANVNRKTFYNHYASIQDVRKELEEECIDMIFSLLKTDDPDSLRQDPMPFVRQLIQVMVDDPVRSRLLFESGEHLYLAERLKAMFLPYLEDMAARSGGRPEHVAYAMEFLVNGTMALLNTWVRDPRQLPPEEVTKLLSALVRSIAMVKDHF